jgi:Siphovirus Gp157
MSQMRLYEIADRYQFLLNDLYDYETGVVNETTLAKLNELTDSMETKAINITMLFKELEASAEAIEKERQAMQKREKALKNQIQSLKDYLRSNMERCEIKKIECPQFVIGLQKNPVKLEIFDENLIPPEYEVMTLSIDEAKIREELKNGVVIPGARLVQGSSIRIR